MILKKINFSKLFQACAIGLICLFIIFEVPYLFPQSVRTISASYDYGFNNTIGILLLIMACGIFATLGFFWTKKNTELKFFDANPSSAQISQREILVTSFVSLLLISLLFLVSGTYGFGESTQFLQAMERISIGQKLYVDFDFYYGPILAFGPYLIYKIGQLVNFEYKTAYFITLAIFQVISLIELRFILNSISLRSGLARKFFYVIVFSTLPFHSGINLILFRFITPVSGFIFLRKKENLSIKWRSAIVLSLSFLTFGLSIEYGVVFSVALCIYLIFSLVIDRTPGSLICLAITMVSPVFFYGLFPGLFHTMHLYLLGAWRWPFVISLHLLIFFTSVFIVAFLIGSQLRDVKKNYFLISLCILAIGSLPAALGRCDPGHVILNGLMIFILAYSYISYTWSKKYIFAMYFAFIMSFGVFCSYPTIKSYGIIYVSQSFKKLSQYATKSEISNLIKYGSILSGLPKDEVARKVQNFNKRQLIDYKNIFQNINTIYSPYMISEDVANYLRKSNKIEYFYFKDYSILASEPEVTKAIEDMKKKNVAYLILPNFWDKLSEPEDNTKTINLLFTTKYNRLPIRNGRLLLSPVINYVKNSYTLDAKFDNFVIMKRSEIR